MCCGKVHIAERCQVPRDRFALDQSTFPHGAAAAGTGMGLGVGPAGVREVEISEHEGSGDLGQEERQMLVPRLARQVERRVA